LKREADELASSPAANKVRTSVGEVGDKLRAPEMQTKVRSELIGALQQVNQELQKVIERWSPSAPSAQDVEMGAAPEAAADPNAPQPGDAGSYPSADFSQPAADQAKTSGFDDQTGGQA
jgi:hypothetical protein